MASTKLTFGSVLNTVTTTANTITGLVSSVGVGANMLNAYADKQAMEQAFQYKLDAVTFKEIARANSGRDLAKQAKEIAAEKAKDPAFAESFDHYFKLLSTIE